MNPTREVDKLNETRLEVIACRAEIADARAEVAKCRHLIANAEYQLEMSHYKENELQVELLAAKQDLVEERERTLSLREQLDNEREYGTEYLEQQLSEHRLMISVPTELAGDREIFDMDEYQDTVELIEADVHSFLAGDSEKEKKSVLSELNRMGKELERAREGKVEEFCFQCSICHEICSLASATASYPCLHVNCVRCAHSLVHPKCGVCNEERQCFKKLFFN